MAKRSLGIPALALCLSLLFATSAAADDRGIHVRLDGSDSVGRIALVIGNAAYKNATPLTNTVNDATLMARALRSIGFDLVGGKAQTNLDKAALIGVIRKFGEAMRGKRVAFLYYAGHGVQVDGRNYLIPTSANVMARTDVKYELVNVDNVLDDMNASGTKVNIIVLDACRNNPFGERGLRGSQSGLAVMDAPSGTLIAYATGPGKTAADGHGKNSPYTESLARVITQPGLDVEDVFREVGKDVQLKTAGVQVPWKMDSMTDKFYFKAQGSLQTTGGPRPASSLSTSERPSTGTIVVKSTPPGASVYVNGSRRGLTPMTISGASPGAVRLRVGLYGYESADDTVQFQAGKEQIASYTLARAPVSPSAKPQIEARVRPSTTPPVFPKREWKDPLTGMEFVWVEGGTYQMGCGPWAANCKPNESPEHEVAVSGFWIGKYTVTQGQWQKIMSANPSGFQKGDNYPVETVSWYDAKEFIQKLNARSANTFRLPTEAEWEYAARSGGKPQMYAGGNDVDAVAWYVTNSGRSTHPVGTKAPNGLGIYDMSGNVFQWCEDIYDVGAYTKPPRNNPLSDSGGSYRVLRGGSWSRDSTWVRSTFRGFWNPGSHGIGGRLGGTGLGLRLVKGN
ncbi:MAG: SUMF1/EgtB/PvdO family nonheme iron enzyme [Syntrophobacteraceae bacterium]|nr:SUMF1/EgtB/PvdO family nonheme iron enzyme [Syntrophobacteraceae bacterium]